MPPTKIRVFKDYKFLCSMNRVSACLIKIETIKRYTQKTTGIICRPTSGAHGSRPGPWRRDLLHTQAFQTAIIHSFANANLLSVQEKLVRELLQKLDPYKSMGPDNVHPRLLRELADILMRLLSIISEQLWRSGNISEDWKKAGIIPSIIPSIKRAKWGPRKL